MPGNSSENSYAPPEALAKETVPLANEAERKSISQETAQKVKEIFSESTPEEAAKKLSKFGRMKDFVTFNPDKVLKAGELAWMFSIMGAKLLGADIPDAQALLQLPAMAKGMSGVVSGAESQMRASTKLATEAVGLWGGPMTDFVNVVKDGLEIAPGGMREHAARLVNIFKGTRDIQIAEMRDYQAHAPEISLAITTALA